MPDPIISNPVIDNPVVSSPIDGGSRPALLPNPGSAISAPVIENPAVTAPPGAASTSSISADARWDDLGDDARIELSTPLLDKQIKQVTISKIEPFDDSETDSRSLSISLQLAEKATSHTGRELFEGTLIRDRAQVKAGSLENGGQRCEIGWRTLAQIAVSAGTLPADNYAPKKSEIQAAVMAAVGKKVRASFKVVQDRQGEDRQRISYLRPEKLTSGVR